MSGAEIPLLIGAIAGTGIDIYGRVKSAEAQKEAQEQQAALKRIQADELMARQAINEDVLRRQGALVKDQYAAQFAATGRAGGGIGGQLEIMKNLEQNISISRREAAFKASQLRAGADIESSLASDLMSSAYFGAAGSLIKTGTAIGSMMRGPSKSKDLDLGSDDNRFLTGSLIMPELTYPRTTPTWSLLGA